MNTQRKFDALQKEKLGNYIYALRDPRDKKIFYVGQGTNDRVFDHFHEAETCLNSEKPFKALSSKVIRILDIWKNTEDVQWLILAHNLPTDTRISGYIESAIVDGLSESQNGDTLNEVSPPNSSRLSPDDLDAMAAEFVNPQEPYHRVFVFPIQNALTNGTTPYNATRTTWAVNSHYRSLQSSYAVGLKHSISKGSFEIASWVPVNETGKYEFTSPDHPNPAPHQPLLNKNWNNVLSKAKGYWQRGNYLIVEFDGQGKFKIIRGTQDYSTWYDCL
jgi:uncharacterized protein